MWKEKDKRTHNNELQIQKSKQNLTNDKRQKFKISRYNL